MTTDTEETPTGTVDEIHARHLERARRVVLAFKDASMYDTNNDAVLLAAAFQAAADALHEEADAAAEARKRGHQSLTKDLRNAAGRVVGIAQDLMELSKMDSDARSVMTVLNRQADQILAAALPDLQVARYTEQTDPVTSSDDVVAYLRGDTDEVPDSMTPADMDAHEQAAIDAGNEIGAPAVAVASERRPRNVPAFVEPTYTIIDETHRFSAEQLKKAVQMALDRPYTATDALGMDVPVTNALNFMDPTPFRSGPNMPPGTDESMKYTYNDLMQPVSQALVPAHWSWSQLTTIEDCGVQYRGQRLEGVRQVPQWANVGGSSFHNVTEAFDRGAYIAGGADLLAEVHPELVRQRWRDAFAAEIHRVAMESGIEMGDTGDQWRASRQGAEGYTWWLVEGERMLARYIDLRRKLDKAGREAGTLAVPLELDFQNDSARTYGVAPVIEWPYERTVSGPLGDLTVKGVVDRAYRATDGTIIIKDLKSGQVKPAITGQLGEYAWAIVDTIEGVTGVPLDVRILGSFYDARKGLFTDPVDLLAKHPREEYTFRYHAAEAQRRLGIFTPRRSDFCNGCSIRWACPVGGES